MKWYWIVIWVRETGDGTESGTIRSEPFDTEAAAITNLQARVNQPKPDMPLPSGAYIASYATELKT